MVRCCGGTTTCPQTQFAYSPFVEDESTSDESPTFKRSKVPRTRASLPIRDDSSMAFSICDPSLMIQSRTIEFSTLVFSEMDTFGPMIEFVMHASSLMYTGGRMTDPSTCFA